MHDIDLMLDHSLRGEFKESRAISDKLEALGPKGILDTRGKNTEEIWMRHCFNRGWFLLQDGEYQKGSQLLESGRSLSVYGSQKLFTQAPIYNPYTDDIKGKSIIISLEGGYGDEIIFARFAQSFKALGADKVYLAAAPEVQSIFSRIPGVDKVILRNQANTVAHDFWVPGFSSAWIAGHTYEDLPNDPYLFPLQDSVNIWKGFISSEKVKIGIRWAGNPKFEHQQFRRFPEEFITNLAKYEEVQLYSLQRDNNLIQLPEGIIDLQHLLLSWEDTMAAIDNLDIVVTSCTAIAHLAAGMGKETWVIVPVLPYHTWTYKAPESNTSPYYKCVRLFRQKEYKKWNGAFQELYAALEEKFDLKHVDMPNEDRVAKKVNIGCGLSKMREFINVDSDMKVNPDVVADLNVLPWPFEDNAVDHIVAKDILEHLGETGEDFIKIIKEMYRISENGAIWEIQVPHWRCDLALDDPTHRRLITKGTFNMFSQKNLKDRLMKFGSDSRLAFDEDIDIEICDVQFDFIEYWQQKRNANEMSEDELTFALNVYNNVASSMRLLIQVHKPGRVSQEEIDQLLNQDNRAE